MSPTTAELGHDPVSDAPPPGDLILDVPLSRICPSPENDAIYRPADPTDPGLQSLARDIEEKGVLEPLVLTRDHYILSGHRRFAASRLAGLQTVPCRFVDFARVGNDDFPRLLAAYNQQRVKTFAEQVREQVLAVNPNDAYAALLAYRAAKAKPPAAAVGEAVQLAGRKRRCEVSAAKDGFVWAILRVLEDNRDYWPLSVRQVHYLLLNDPPLRHASKSGSTYRNDATSYKSLVELATRLRHDGTVNHDALGDKTRSSITWATHRDAGAFVGEQLAEFLGGYTRNLLQSQPHYVQIVGEKNTVESVIRPVAMEFTVPYLLGRGYSSTPPRKELADRFAASGCGRLVLLVLSDCDPEGDSIPETFARSMRDDFGIRAVSAIKVALTRQQAADMGLPRNAEAKRGSSRRKGYVERHGDDAVFELEAVPIPRLQGLLRDAICSVLDLGAYTREVEAERHDAGRLAALRGVVQRALATCDLTCS